MVQSIRFNVRNYDKFKELVKELENDHLFAHNISNLKTIESEDEGLGYEVPAAFWIESALDLKIIELRKDSPEFLQKKVIGSYEVFLGDGILEWVRAKGGELQYGLMGQWRCTYCDTIQANVYEYQKGKITRPYICGNEECGRKDRFQLTSPPHLQRPIWLLPGKPKECTESQLFEKLIDFYKQQLVLKEYEYNILALWVMASWLVDDFKTCPYLALIAPKSSGKTQVLETIRQTAYRAFATSSVTPPALFRSIELWRITLCIDEAQDLINSNTETGQAIYACLLAGYKRGIFALRAGEQATGFMPEAFDLFGFKAFSGTKLVLDTLESRSITLDMRKAKPKKILIDEDTASELRSMLLWYRFTHLHKLRLRMPHECESGRLIELFAPLYTVEDGIQCKESLDFMIDKMLSRDKESEKNSLEAEIVGAIDNIMQLPATGTFTERSMVMVDEIIYELAWDRDRKSSTAIGKQLKVLGIPSKHTKHGNGIDINNPAVRDIVDKLIERYVT